MDRAGPKSAQVEASAPVLPEERGQSPEGSLAADPERNGEEAPHEVQGNGSVDNTTDRLAPAIPQPSSCSPDELVPYIRKFIEVIAGDDQVVELRSFGCPRYPEKRNGYFDDLDALAKAAVRLSHSDGADLVAVTLNPVDSNLLARRRNAIGKIDHGTQDEDIVHRQWLMIDLDPVRKSGIPATDAEHRAAHDLRHRVQQELSVRGFPDPIVCDSGNGAHLLYRVNLPNDERSADLLKTFLATLDTNYATEAVKVDRTTFNAARLCRLPGTKNRKGSGTETRPHRNSRVLDLPESIRPVPEELLRSFVDDATPAGESADASEGSSNSQASEDLDAPSAAEESVALVELLLKDNSIKHRKRRPWKGGYLWSLKSCPFAEHSEPNKSFIAVLPNGALSAGCKKDGCHERGWRDIKVLYKDWFDKQASRRRTSQQDTSKSMFGRDRYEIRGGGIVRVTVNDKGLESVTKLTNFDARITSVSHEHDGADTRTFYDIEAVVKGRQYSFSVLATQFPGLEWVHEHLGANAIVYAGYGIKDRAREAIQLLSGDIQERTIYSHLGWLRTPNGPVYLHAGGAIGDPSLHVNVRSPLDRFLLPDPPSGQDLVAAIRASLSVLELEPLTAVSPAYCAVWRAAIGEPPDLSIWIVGRSGTFKSELCSLCQRHYGAGMDRERLPGNWSSTSNYNEQLGFRAKDALLCVDDFVPEPGNAQRLQRDAERLLRAQGNRSGRGRLRADASMRESRPPRGIILASGEDVPFGFSLQARIVIVQVRPGEIDAGSLAACQADAAAGLYASAMAGFLDWLRARLGTVQGEIPAFVQGFRGRSAISGHARTTDQIAQLLFGLKVFLRFAVDAGAVGQDDADRCLDRVTGALLAVAPEQEEHHAAEDPVEQFVGLLGAALAAGRVHLAHLAHSGRQETEEVGGSPAEAPRGDCVGWRQNDNVYLNSSAAFAAAQRLAQEQGTRITITLPTLRKRLYEAGYLQSVEVGPPLRYEVRRQIGPSRLRVLHLQTTSLSLGGQVSQVSHEDVNHEKTQTSLDDSWPTTKTGVGRVGQRVGHTRNGLAHSDQRLAHSTDEMAHPPCAVSQAPHPSPGAKAPSSGGACTDAMDAAPPHPPPLDPALETAIRGALPPGATPAPADLERWRDAFEERAAVLELDGGLSRAEAERQALEFVAQDIERTANPPNGADGAHPHA